MSQTYVYSSRSMRLSEPALEKWLDRCRTWVQLHSTRPDNIPTLVDAVSVARDPAQKWEVLDHPRVPTGTAIWQAIRLRYDYLYCLILPYESALIGRGALNDVSFFLQRQVPIYACVDNIGWAKVKGVEPYDPNDWLRYAELAF